MKLKLVTNSGTVIEFDHYFLVDAAESNCPNQIKINGEDLKNRCYLNDCMKCWQKALAERGYNVEIIH